MKAVVFIGLLVAITPFVGCVGQREPAQTTLQLDNVMSRLDNVQRSMSEQTAAIEALKVETRAATLSGSSEEARVEEIRRLSDVSQETHAELVKVTAERDTAVANLQSEGALRFELHEQIGRLQAERDELERVATELKEKAERLQGEIVTMQKELSAAHQERQAMNQALEEMRAAAQAEGREKEELFIRLNMADERQREMSATLEAEQNAIVAVSHDRDAVQRQIHTLHDELTQAHEALAEADRHISRLSEENDRLKAEGAHIGMQHLDNELQSQQLTPELSHARRRISEMSQTFTAVDEQGSRAEREGPLLAVLPDREGKLEQSSPMETTENQVVDRKPLEPKGVPEDERSQLTKAQEALQSVFLAEIAHEDIKVQQLEDQLIVNLKKQALFSYGQSELHAKGLTVLRRASAVFQSLTDKYIRIEGYTPYTTAGANLQERVRFQSNWVLSGERAIAVRQYFIEKGGVPASNVSAGGFAVRVGTTDRGEELHVNELRIHIGLHPKDLSVTSMP
ncbi:OmpA family protein [Nitrospira sp. Nam74]